jgi:hypothetical protein
MFETLENQAREVPEHRWRSDKSLAEQLGLTADQPTIAVLIPCRNEEAAIGKVVGDFTRALPDAIIYVYDHYCPE